VAALVINVVAAVSTGDVPLNAVQVIFSFPFWVMPTYEVRMTLKISVYISTASLGKSNHGHSGSTSPGNGTTN